MDENGTVQGDCRSFARPFFLLSLVFFLPDISILAFLAVEGIRSAIIQLFPSSPGLIVTVYLLPFGIVGLGLLVSSAGAVLILRELIARSLSPAAGIPLCAFFGAVFAAAVLSSFPQSVPSWSILVIFSLAMIMCMPAGVAYLLRAFPGAAPAAVRSFANAAGIFGLAVSGLLLFFILIIQRMSGLSHVFLIVMACGLVHLTVLMPVVGLKVVQLGTGFSRTPPAGEGAGTAAGSRPHKTVGELIRGIRQSVSPRLKWGILIALVLVLVVAACYVYLDVTDTTPCRKWTEVTLSAPFGARNPYAIAEFHGDLWLIGGRGGTGGPGDLWHTADMTTWTRESPAGEVPRRPGMTAASFRDTLWLLGGVDDMTFEPGNGIWYSGNGINWTAIGPRSGFTPRAWHSTVVFHDRIWVIGGNRGTLTNELANDVWYSDDGISWVQATPATGFSPRSDHVSFVYNDRIWVAGGRDEKGYVSDFWSSGDGINWTQATGFGPFAPSASFAAVVFDGRIWVIQTAYEKERLNLWPAVRSQGIWYSYDGAAWTQVRSSPEFFREEFNGGEAVPVVFGNRLYAIERYGRDTGIWYTLPSGPSG